MNMKSRRQTHTFPLENTPQTRSSFHDITNRRLLLLRLLVVTSQRIPLCRNTLLSPLSGCLGLRTLGIHLLLQDPLTLLFGLRLVNLFDSDRQYVGNKTALPRKTYVLNQCPLVFEGVTLAQMVKFVIKVLVDLAARTVFD